MENIPLYMDDDQIKDYSGSFKKGWKKIAKVLRYRERHPNNNRLDWLNQKRLEQAIDYFKKCLEAYPRSWSSMWGLAKAYQVTGEHQTALNWFEKVYALKQDLVDIASEASTEAMRIGNAPKAIEYAKKALALDRRNPQFQANFALALLLDKQGDESLAEAEKAVKMGLNNKTAGNIYSFIQSVVQNNEKNYPVAIDPVKFQK